MGRMSDAFIERREELAEQYLKEHPGCDPQDAYDYADKELGGRYDGNFGQD